MYKIAVLALVALVAAANVHTVKAVGHMTGGNMAMETEPEPEPALEPEPEPASEPESEDAGETSEAAGEAAGETSEAAGEAKDDAGETSEAAGEAKEEPSKAKESGSAMKVSGSGSGSGSSGKTAETVSEDTDTTAGNTDTTAAPAPGVSKADVLAEYTEAKKTEIKDAITKAIADGTFTATSLAPGATTAEVLAVFQSVPGLEGVTEAQIAAFAGDDGKFTKEELEEAAAALGTPVQNVASTPSQGFSVQAEKVALVQTGAPAPLPIASPTAPVQLPSEEEAAISSETSDMENAVSSMVLGKASSGFGATPMGSSELSRICTRRQRRSWKRPGRRRPRVCRHTRCWHPL